MGKPFVPGDPRAGRPKGARNKFDAFVYGCVLTHMRHKRGDPPPAEYADTNLWADLEVTLTESKRGDYLARIISMLSKEFTFERAPSELSDEELEMMIARQLEELAKPQEQPLLIEAKVNDDRITVPAE